MIACGIVLSLTGSAFATPSGMSVSGSTLLKDGLPFHAHGFTMVGALAPQWCDNGPYVAARSHYGIFELSDLVNTWHANTLRLQVSQEGLGDTANYSATQIDDYLSQVEAAVQLARSFGLVVILSMQDQAGGCGLQHQLPDATTAAAWTTLAPAFADDPYVMFELFNEPQNSSSDSSQWAQWQSGGGSPLCNAGTTPTCSTAVGYQTLVDDVRSWGADNVLLADGGNSAEHFNGAGPYLPRDSSAGLGIAYAVHPYYFNPSSSFAKDEAYYQNSYGFLVDSGYPVIATEWNYLKNHCKTDAPKLAPQFLTWLERKGIGMTAMAGDYPGRTVADWNWHPTRCGSRAGGSGQQLLTWYQHLAQTQPNR